MLLFSRKPKNDVLSLARGLVRLLPLARGLEERGLLRGLLGLLLRGLLDRGLLGLLPLFVFPLLLELHGRIILLHSSSMSVERGWSPDVSTTTP